MGLGAGGWASVPRSIVAEPAPSRACPLIPRVAGHFRKLRWVLHMGTGSGDKGGGDHSYSLFFFLLCPLQVNKALS